MNKIEIKHRFTGDVIFSHEQESNSILITLTKAIKEGTFLGNASLEGASLEGASLEGASLRGAFLRGASLRGASLEGARLEGASLEGARLEGAFLRGASLRGASLRGASDYYSFFAFDTSKRIVHCIKHDKTWMILAGCFWGTLAKLEEKVLTTHNSPVYLANIEILKNL